MCPHQVFVLHSAYPDGSWRGLEKCFQQFFDTRDDAAQFLKENLLDPYFRIVEVTLITPSVRRALDSATLEKVDPLVPQDYTPNADD